MARIEYGTFITAATGVQQVVNIGFVPNSITLKNITKLSVGAAASGIGEVYTDQQLALLSGGAETLVTTYTAGAPVVSSIASGTVAAAAGVVGFATPDALLFVPSVTVMQTNLSTNLIISAVTAITKAANASITATHNFTTADIGTTVVTIHGVQGMTQINNISGIVTSVTGTTSFTVNINSSNFSTHVPAAGAVANVITGAPVNSIYGNQSLPTSSQNLGVIGVIVGTTVIGTIGDVWSYTALLDE
jgi:hypothetical protein